MRKRGKFITIEGQDGAGKSTNIAVVERWLRERNIEYVQTREPGGTKFGETIRSLILDSNDSDFGDNAELLLMFAARAQHIQEVIEPALACGSWVLCDRFTDATYAYQGGGRGVNMGDIIALEQTVQKDLRPDLTLLLDVPVEVGESRAGEREGEPDRFETQEIEFKKRVRATYLDLAKQEPQRIKVVNANQSIEQVRAVILSQLTLFANRSAG